MALQRVLVGSPVCERASVLRAFLISLKSLEHEGFLIDYIFIDDNDSEISEKLLKNFKREGSEVTAVSYTHLDVYKRQTVFCPHPGNTGERQAMCCITRSTGMEADGLRVLRAGIFPFFHG